MPDNLLDLYLGSGTKQAPVVTDIPQGTSLLDTYLTPSKQPVTSKYLPSVDGVTPSAPGSEGLVPNPDPSTVERLFKLPVEVTKNIGKAGWEGVERVVEGGKDIAASRAATGVGNVGLGLMQTAVSPVTGILKTAGDYAAGVGGREFGDKVELAAGAGLPIARISKALPKNQAIEAIVDTIGADKLPEVIQRLKSNPRLTLMDVNMAIRQMAQKLVTTEGKHQNKFEDIINQRIATAKGSVESIYNDAMGIPVNVKTKLDELKKAAEKVGKEKINPAFTNAGRVDISPVLTHIDSQVKPGAMGVISAGQPLPYDDIKKALENTKKLLTDGKSVQTSAEDLHWFQSALRGRAEDFLSSTNGQERQIGRALMGVRNKIVDAIDVASPQLVNAKGKIEGTYKKALGEFRDEKQIDEAFMKGITVTRNRPSQFDDRPEFWAEWVKDASKHELSAVREGARIAVDQQINGFRNAAAKGEAIPEIEFNKQKLELLFGKEIIDKMAKKLRDERDIASTNVKLVEGSQTAMRMKNNKNVDLPVVRPFSIGSGLSMLPPAIMEAGSLYMGGVPGIGAGLTTAGMVAGAIGKKISDVSKLKLAEGKNTHLTDLVSSTGAERDALIKMLENYAQPKQSLLQKGHNLMLPVFRP